MTVQFSCENVVKIANNIDKLIVKYDFAENKCFKENRIDSTRKDLMKDSFNDEQIFDYQKNICNLNTFDFAKIQCQSAIDFVKTHGTVEEVVNSMIIIN